MTMDDPQVSHLVPEDSPPPVEAAVQREYFRFSGEGAEYFRIWIVNVLFSIVTFGIYSAWAKVRRLRYFYGNTSLAGSTFEYHGRPGQILKGRLLAGGVFVLVSVIGAIWPLANLLVFVLILFGTPWVVVKARTFQARMSSYRNIRFNFSQDYRDASRVFVGLALLVAPTLGLIYPYWTYRRYRFAIDNSRFGATPFALLADGGTFYRIYVRAGLILIPVLLLILLIGAAVNFGRLFAGYDTRHLGTLALSIPLTLLIIVVPYLIVYAYLQKSLLNASFGNTTLGPHRLLSQLQWWPLWRLYVTNTVLTLLTLGLYWPWAAVNLARYRFESLSLEMRGGLDQFLAEQQADLAAAGEEFGDLFDIDLGL